MLTDITEDITKETTDVAKEKTVTDDKKITGSQNGRRWKGPLKIIESNPCCQRDYLKEIT